MIIKTIKLIKSATNKHGQLCSMFKDYWFKIYYPAQYNDLDEYIEKYYYLYGLKLSDIL